VYAVALWTPAWARATVAIAIAAIATQIHALLCRVNVIF
jgi:hypothetical protein